MEKGVSKSQGPNSFRQVAPRSFQEAVQDRYPMTCKVHPSGRCELNVTAHGGVKRQALRKGLSGAYHLVTAVDDTTGKVAIYVVPVESADSIRPRSLSTGGLSFSLDHVLNELPGLRPTFRVKCSVNEMTDSEGEPCLVINLAAQLAHFKRPAQEAAPAAQGEAKKQ